MEDRLLSLELMAKVSDELEAAGFKHVLTRHHVDPAWRRSYRPDRPELEPISWTVAVEDYLIPLRKLKSLIDICERHGLVFWVRCQDSEEGMELYLNLGTSEHVTRSYVTPNP